MSVVWSLSRFCFIDLRSIQCGTGSNTKGEKPELWFTADQAHCHTIRVAQKNTHTDVPMIS